MPEKREFVVGLQTHSIFKRYLEDQLGELRSLQHLFLISYGIFDWLSIDLKGGVGNIKQHPPGSDEVDYTSRFAGGYGFRCKLYEEKKLRLVFGFQHISVHPRSVHIEGARNKAIIDDWQVSFLASYTIAKFTPYLGTKWSRVDYIHKIGDSRKRRMSDATKSIGVVFGTDMLIRDDLWLNLEGQAVDGESLAFSINYKF